MTWWLLFRIAVVLVIAAVIVSWALIPNDTDCEWEVERDG